MIARVWARGMRFPAPNAPPVHPVLTSQTRAPCLFIFAASSSAYLPGCQTRNGPPKHGENVADGSFTPISVPATFAVYPLMKWYIAWVGESLLTGGSTPKASQVRKMMSVGCPAMQGILAFGIESI